MFKLNTKKITYIVAFILAISPIFSTAKQCLRVPLKRLNLQNTEAEFCFSCQFDTKANSQSNLQQLQRITNIVPARECFKKSIHGRKQGLNATCNNGSLKRPRGRRTEICKTDDYINTTAQAFHEVSRCLDIKKPEYFFALLNRESRFQITAESHTGASCYGQLTGIAIADINNRFMPFEVSDAEANCQAVIDNFEMLPTKGRRKISRAVCTASSNPYTCLVYSGIYYKQALDDAKKLIDGLDFLKVTLHGETDKLFHFQNNTRLQKWLNKRPGQKIKKIERKSVFQDKNFVAQMIAYQSYNGGSTSVRNMLEIYTNHIKARAWSNKDYRNQVLNGNPSGISSSDFLATFRQYSRNSRTLKHYKENSDFPQNILKDYRSITKDSPACGDIPTHTLRPTGRFQSYR